MDNSYLLLGEHTDIFEIYIISGFHSNESSYPHFQIRINTKCDMYPIIYDIALLCCLFLFCIYRTESYRFLNFK